MFRTEQNAPLVILAASIGVQEKAPVLVKAVGDAVRLAGYRLIMPDLRFNPLASNLETIIDMITGAALFIGDVNKTDANVVLKQGSARFTFSLGGGERLSRCLSLPTPG